MQVLQIVSGVFKPPVENLASMHWDTDAAILGPIDHEGNAVALRTTTSSLDLDLLGASSMPCDGMLSTPIQRGSGAGTN